MAKMYRFTASVRISPDYAADGPLEKKREFFAAALNHKPALNKLYILPSLA